MLGRKISFLLFFAVTLSLLGVGAAAWNKSQEANSIPLSNLTAEQRSVAQYLIEAEWQLGRLSLEERLYRLSEFYINDPRFPLSPEQKRFVQQMLPLLGDTVEPVSERWGQLTFEQAWTKRLIEGYSLLQRMEAGQVNSQEVARMRQKGIEPIETRPPYQSRKEAEELFDFYAFEKNTREGIVCVLHRFGDAKAKSCLVEQGGHWYIAYRKVFPWASLPPTESQK